jgi:hypothetical protein
MTCTYIRTAAQRNSPERVLPFNHNHPGEAVS